MAFVDFLFAPFFAITFTAIIAGVFRIKGQWGSIALLFVMILLVTWAGGVWLSPLGSGLYGTYRLPFLLVALFFSLILAATVAPSAENAEASTSGEAERIERRTSLGALGLFFWVLLAALIIAIVLRYVA